MYLEVITPDAKVFEGEVIGVKLPGKLGSFEVLDNHAPIVSTLDKGVIRVRTPKDVKFFQVAGGIMEMLTNKVVVLSEDCQPVKDEQGTPLE
jgi:F-type H+-transporting ATPase subunit epsilon